MNETIELTLRKEYKCYAPENRCHCAWWREATGIRPEEMRLNILRVLEIDGRFHIGRVRRQDGAIYMNTIAVFDTVEAARMCYELEAAR